MINFIIPGIVFGILLYGLYKNVNIYDVFLDGVREGLEMILKIFPTMFAMVIAVEVLIQSSILQDLINTIEPMLVLFHFPKELFSLAVMRPISGSSSLVLLNHILQINGPDSYVGRIASVIQGSTDTTIYIISLYFSSIGVRKVKYSLIVGLLADFCCVVLAVIVISLLF